MKLPTSVGQKKAKAIESVLDELGIGQYLLLLLFCSKAIWPFNVLDNIDS